MVVYKSTYDPIPLPNVDICSFVFGDNKYNTRFSRDRKVLLDGHSNRSLSFNEVKDMSSRLAAGWVDKVGLKQGDVVAVFAPNQYDHMVLYLSLLAAKVTVTPGNPSYTEAEFKHQITNSKAKALVTVPALLPILLKVCAEAGIPKERIFLFGDQQVEGCRPWKTLIGQRQILPPITGVDPVNDVAFICYSSGTTGVAKGVMLSHRNFIAQTLQMLGMETEEPSEDEMTLGFLPFFHIYGLSVLCINSFYKQVPVVIMSKFDLKHMCELIQNYKITSAAIVPPVAVLLSKSPIVTQYDLSSLKQLGCGAAPLGKEHIDALNKRVSAVVKQGYGMTETTSGVLTQRSEGGVPGSIGILTPNIECKMVDENDNELGDDQEGELLIRGPSVMLGYLDNEEANAKTFAGDGWMRTGDVCKYDSKSGEFFIVDRIKELIKYKGFQVAPAELEAVLLGRPDIADCCVIGVYDNAQATEIPRAYVVLQPSVKPSEALAKDIMDYVAKNLTNYKKLRGGVRFVDAIPKSTSGKILRRQVRDWVKKEEAETKASAKL